MWLGAMLRPHFWGKSQELQKYDRTNSAKDQRSPKGNGKISVIVEYQHFETFLNSMAFVSQFRFKLLCPLTSEDIEREKNCQIVAIGTAGTNLKPGSWLFEPRACQDFGPLNMNFMYGWTS